MFSTEPKGINCIGGWSTQIRNGSLNLAKEEESTQSPWRIAASLPSYAQGPDLTSRIGQRWVCGVGSCGERPAIFCCCEDWLRVMMGLRRSFI
uniref:Uncharacterized protein n=1 Tax=Arundo donax TaxID=35708 RepID=A0A0A9HY38_ARUDO